MAAAEPLVEASVAQLLNEVLGELREADRVVVAVEPESLRRTLFVPLMSVAQALRGLLDNALDATPDKSVHLRATVHDETLEVQVEDQGKGMAADVRERAFDPFFTTKEPGRGMGLGLFLARNVLQRLGGSIELLTATGEGTTVTVRLPMRA